MKYEIIMRTRENSETVVTPSFGDANLYGDLDYVRRCLAQCLFRVFHNGVKVKEHIYCDLNGHVMLWGFVVEGDYSYCIRKAVKQEKFNVSSR
jgi:hypothetical protein